MIIFSETIRNSCKHFFFFSFSSAAVEIFDDSCLGMRRTTLLRSSWRFSKVSFALKETRLSDLFRDRATMANWKLINARQTEWSRVCHSIQAINLLIIILDQRERPRIHSLDVICDWSRGKVSFDDEECHRESVSCSALLAGRSLFICLL